MTDANGATGRQEAPGSPLDGMVASERRRQASESQRASGDAVMIVRRKKEAWHRAWNLANPMYGAESLVCRDPLNALEDSHRHHLCRVFGDLVESAIEGAGWRMVPMTEADHRAFMAASEELLMVLAWPDDGVIELMPLLAEQRISLGRRIRRFFLGDAE